MGAHWHQASNIEEVDSPSLLIYPDRVQENIRRMLSLVPADRLRPHIKTHKLSEVIRMQMDSGIRKFKCATIAEAEILAECEAPDVLLAYQLVGPKAGRLLTLAARFPKTKFSAIVDDADAIRALSAASAHARTVLDVMLDVDCGMRRSGVEIGERAKGLYRLISSLPGLNAAGIHAYDGHIHDRDPQARAQACEAAFGPVMAFAEGLKQSGQPVQRIIAGGTPTFPMHARRDHVECSPGTTLFWDYGYQTKYPDMDYLPAALVLTRVVSKPGANRLCLDLGHKAIASENPHPRVHLLELPDAKPVVHSEEHLVVETPEAERFRVGDVLYGVPWHVCPTVALHSDAWVIRNGKVCGLWKIRARARTLTV